jgi:hypothetical protein
MQRERINRGLSQSEGARSSHGERGVHDSDSAGLGGGDAKKVADDVVTAMWFAFLAQKITAEPETHLRTYGFLCCVALVT